MSTKTLTKTTLADAIEKYRHYPLASLVENETFQRELMGTGVNHGNMLSRRFNFSKPKINIAVSQDRRRVDINLHYGLGGVTTLASVEREHLEDIEATLFVPRRYTALYTLEPEISQLIGIPGYTLPEDIRHKTIGTFLSDDTLESKYSFDLNIAIDTLTTYGECKFIVSVSQIDIADALTLIARGFVETGAEPYDQSTEIFHIHHHDASVVPLAMRFKQHLGSQPLTLPKGE